ncbi:hypothetical protein B0O99DRAFT_747382 [Bisporella sp. PMI_857]|nr:hypothetical protein B0O99DRAFT_747382 [Bisporella sp. PMI_857]
MNGTLFAPESRGMGRIGPGPATDALWHDTYEQFPMFVITKEQVLKLGKDPNTAARYPDEYWGLGGNAYMASMDMFHQIHCVNMLRRAAFSRYPGAETDLPNNDTFPWVHLTHCVDNLLQNLKCYGSTDMYTYSWMETFKEPWPDFSISHKCRDFGALVDWANSNAVDREKFGAMAKFPLPNDTWVWPAPWLGHGGTELGHRLDPSLNFKNHDLL